jgi:hypothetical protein
LAEAVLVVVVVEAVVLDVEVGEVYFRDFLLAYS